MISFFLLSFQNQMFSTTEVLTARFWTVSHIVAVHAHTRWMYLKPLWECLNLSHIQHWWDWWLPLMFMFTSMGITFAYSKQNVKCKFSVTLTFSSSKMMGVGFYVTVLTSLKCRLSLYSEGVLCILLIEMSKCFDLYIHKKWLRR